MFLAGLTVLFMLVTGAQTPAADAASAFTALEERLLKAETVKFDFQANAEGAITVDLRGSLHIGPGDRIVLTAAGTFAGKPVDLSLRAAGAEMQIGGKTLPRPAHLREALVIGLTRMGILHNLARLSGGREPDHATGGVREWVTVGTFGARTGETGALSFDITVGGQPAGSASLEIDATGRPGTRRQTVKFPHGEMRVTERYSNVIVEGDRPGPMPAPKEDASLEEQLRMRAKEFSAAVVRASASGWAAEDVEALAKIYSEDTIVFPPRAEPIRGRSAVRAYWTRTPDRRILAHTVHPERIDISTDLAADHGRFELTWQTGDAPPQTASSTYVSVWKRDRDGIWRKHLDSWW